MKNYISQVMKEFPEAEYNVCKLEQGYECLKRDDMTEEDILQALTKAAVELTQETEPKWEYIGARFLYMKFAKRLKSELEKREINDFYEKIQYLTKEGLYGSYILEHYSKEEILEAESYMKEERNNLFN